MAATKATTLNGVVRYTLAQYARRERGRRTTPTTPPSYFNSYFMSPKHHHEPRKSPYAYSQEAFHTGWTHHSHALTDNFLRAADAVSLADLQHSPLPAAERLDSLQHKLGHLFTHRNLLLLALTHPSVRRLKLADPTCARSSHAPTRTRRALGAHSPATTTCSARSPGVLTGFSQQQGALVDGRLGIESRSHRAAGGVEHRVGR